MWKNNFNIRKLFQVFFISSIFQGGRFIFYEPKNKLCLGNQGCIFRKQRIKYPYKSSYSISRAPAIISKIFYAFLSCTECRWIVFPDTLLLPTKVLHSSNKVSHIVYTVHKVLGTAHWIPHSNCIMTTGHGTDAISLGHSMFIFPVTRPLFPSSLAWQLSCK